MSLGAADSCLYAPSTHDGADAPRPTGKQAVTALRVAGIEVVMLTGGNECSVTCMGPSVMRA